MRKINTCASTVRQFVATLSINEFQCAKCRDKLSRGRDNLSRKFARQFAATETPYCTLHGTTRASHQEFPKKKKSEETKLPFRGSRFFDDSSRARSLRVTPRTQNKRTSCRWETDHVRDRALSTRALSRRTFARRVRCVAPTLLFQSVVTVRRPD